MKTYPAIWPEPGERFARQPEQPLPPWPDGRLQQLNAHERGVQWEHVHRGHDTPRQDCYACKWETAI